ncbi:SLAC1 family transporter, partial [Streptomyces vinaceus]
TDAAVAADAVLYTAGTAIAVVTAALVPYLMVVRHKVEAEQATPVWLLPVVAPMVSAALGPQLIPHLPAGQAREAMLLGCYTLFGLSLLATLLMLPLILGRLITSGPLPLQLTPALFLVLGPLGQSATAASQLADAAPAAVQAPYAHALESLAVLYAVPVMGFALLWLALATAMLVRAARNGMGFAMTWWALTFPIGTCVTGATGLAHHTGLTAYAWLATALLLTLLTTWTTATLHTLRGLHTGHLLHTPR